MKRHIYINIDLQEDKIQELKKKTEEKTTKDALVKAVDHYLCCHLVSEEDKVSRKKLKSGKTPVHLKKV